MTRSLAELATAKLRTAAGKSESRRKLIGAVHGAAKAAGLTEEDRRAIYADVVPGATSLTGMSIAEIGRVLDRLNQGRSRPMAHRPHVAKVRALWWTLYWLGDVDSPNDKALDAFVRRQAGIDGLRFLDHRNAPAVIEALKAWAERSGVCWPVRARTDAPDGDANAERLAVIDAIWLKLIDRRAVIGTRPDPYIFAALKPSVPNRHRWTARELDEAIKLLGKRLRRAMRKADAL